MLFGKSVISPEELANKLIQGIAEKPGLEDEPNTEWTAAVKLILSALGEEIGCSAHFTDRNNHKSEYLVDFLWWRKAAGNESVALAMECEWGNPWVGRNYRPKHQAEVIGADFEKLLVIKAPLKLMIFATSGDFQSMRTQVFDEIKRLFEQYEHHVAGEQYVFIDFAPASERKAFLFEVLESGPVREFTPIELSFQR